MLCVGEEHAILGPSPRNVILETSLSRPVAVDLNRIELFVPFSLSQSPLIEVEGPAAKALGFLIWQMTRITAAGSMRGLLFGSAVRLQNPDSPRLPGQALASNPSARLQRGGLFSWGFGLGYLSESILESTM